MRTSPFENGFNGFAGINVLKTTPAVKQEKGEGKGLPGKSWGAIFP
jgi:hypothetical protein